MASTRYGFVSWGDYARGNRYPWTSGDFSNVRNGFYVDWHWDQRGKTITIDGIVFTDETWWAVGSSMLLRILWDDGAITDIANGTYNFVGGGMITVQRGAGFVNRGGVLGCFDDANGHLPVSHWFAGNTGGFTIGYGSTAGTINNLNPQPYGILDPYSGDNTHGIVFVTPPNIWGNVGGSNTKLYAINSWVDGIDWGIGWNWRSLTCNVSYNLDGKNINYNAGSWGDGPSYRSVDVDASHDAVPWDRVPDDQTITVTWTASTDIGASSKSVNIYCQPSYEVFVIEEGVNGGQPVASEMKVSPSTGAQPTQGVRRVTTIDG